MDMYLGMGPEVSYPLVLHMLQQALEDEDAEIRSHSFDTIYNLSVHSQMLSITKEETIHEEPEAAGDMSPLESIGSANRKPPSFVSAPHSAAASLKARSSSDRMGHYPVENGSDYQTAKEIVGGDDEGDDNLVNDTYG